MLGGSCLGNSGTDLGAVNQRALCFTLAGVPRSQILEFNDLAFNADLNFARF
jgi:hypothetical protein